MRVRKTLAFVLEFPLASLTSLSLAALLPSTTMAVSLSTGIRQKVGSCVCALPRASLTESERKMIDT